MTIVTLASIFTLIYMEITETITSFLPNYNIWYIGFLY